MIVVVLGTRPEIIKCAPVIQEAQRRGIPISIVHTGQHYTHELDEIFFQELGLPAPVVNLGVGSSDPATQIGRMVQGLAEWFSAHRPSCIVVQGDTNSVLAGALAAYKLGIPVAHLEAGLRSDDWTMPEEGNRVLTGIMTDLHFCPTDLQRQRLAQEGITEGVHVVGNPIVDSVLHYGQQPSDILTRLGFVPGAYALLTMHRPSNVDDSERLASLMACLDKTAQTLRTKIIFPVHPRTEARLRSAALWDAYAQGTSFVFTKPLGYLELLQLQKQARMILTDSGGVQEEATILRVPCITLRVNTERPETVEAGGNILFSTTDVDQLLSLWRLMEARPRTWMCPFGDGTTAKRVVDLLQSYG